ncbi:TPA: LPXTG cell wall anchor domain-containing protein [Streptococcus suis]|nr:LPXTG cell wall anchor domain-containing protein [Streptococcus suis]
MSKDGNSVLKEEEVQPSVPISETNETELPTPPPVNSSNLPSKNVNQIHRPDKLADSKILPNQTNTLEVSRNVQHSDKSLSTQVTNEVWLTNSQNTDQTRLPNTGTKNSYLYIIFGLVLGLHILIARKKL